MRTRIKFCGLTQPSDSLAAAAAGADAIGLVFYPPSARHLDLPRARAIALATPPFITRVALFVDPAPDAVRQVLAAVPIELLQFHGSEPAAFCAQFGKPYLKAVRVRPGLDLIESMKAYESAAGWLLDAYVADRVGGTGQGFDWSLIPAKLARPMVLSGGLDAVNVAAAIGAVKPWAVDVSSGIESAPGSKDHGKMRAFAQAVRISEQS